MGRCRMRTESSSRTRVGFPSGFYPYRARSTRHARGVWAAVEFGLWDLGMRSPTLLLASSNRRSFFMRKLSSIIAGILAAMPTPPACAQSHIYYATTYSTEGSKFTLTIHRDGNRLRFDLDAVAGVSSLSGTPACDRAEVSAVGHFKTYCGRFMAQDPGRYILEGNLNQLIAQLDTVHRFGSAQFKLDACTPGSFPGR
jgi:hypothetical protein